MICSIIWIALCAPWVRRWLDGRKSCSLLCTSRVRSSLNNMLKWLQHRLCFSFLHISLIFSGTCDRFRSGTREWIWILRTRQSILPNIYWPFWSMLRMSTVTNIDVYWSIHLKGYLTTISSPLQWPQHLVNHSCLQLICPAMMKNT